MSIFERISKSYIKACIQFPLLYVAGWAVMLGTMFVIGALMTAAM